jgi:DNA-binding transcriptional ArsR family regulator
MADSTRRAIVECLAHGPLAVGELAERLPVSRPAVSQHLKLLKSARLVRDRAVGTRRIYHLDPTGLNALRADLDRFWGEALGAFKELVDQAEGEKR